MRDISRPYDQTAADGFHGDAQAYFALGIVAISVVSLLVLAAIGIRVLI